MGIKGISPYLSFYLLPRCRKRDTKLTTSGLTALLSENAPRAMRDHEMKTVGHRRPSLPLFVGPQQSAVSVLGHAIIVR